MQCCPRKRSANDSLLDSETGRTYCAACWQQWYDHQRAQSLRLRSATEQKKKRRNGGAFDGSDCNDGGDDRAREGSGSDGEGRGVKLRENAEHASRDREEGTADPADHETLDGLVHDGALYLVNRRTRQVFHTERTEGGRLRVAGRLSEDGSDVPHLFSATTATAGATIPVTPTVDRTAAGYVSDGDGDAGDGDGAAALPFLPDPDDHCETPALAFEDLAPVLRVVAEQLGRSAATLRIWDPYFCAGGSARRLRRLGFLSVHNEPEDFYAVVADLMEDEDQKEAGSGEKKDRRKRKKKDKDRKNGGRLSRIPEHDVIVTNPPYSTSPRDHVHDLVRILVRLGSPFFVVQPAYVYMRPFWEPLITRLPSPRPFFLTPISPRRYKYRTPEALRRSTKTALQPQARATLREVVVKRERSTSPFVTFWYCWVGEKLTESVYRWLAGQREDVEEGREKKEKDTGSGETFKRKQKAREEATGGDGLELACGELFLQDGFKDSSDRTRRKRRKLKRGDTKNSDKQDKRVVGTPTQQGVLTGGVEKKKKKKKKKNRPQ